IKLDGEPYTVIGILPAPFRLDVMHTPDVFIPLQLRANQPRNTRDLEVIGRLRRGVSVQQAQSDLESIARQLARQFPDTNANWSVRLENLRVAFTRFYRASLFLYLGFSLFVLFIACANVAGLQLVRSV